MSDDLTTYICPTCGFPVQFFAGFQMICKTRGLLPSHAFEPPRQDERPDAIRME